MPALQLYRYNFFMARPNETFFDKLRLEAVQERDIVVLPHVTEDYFNITHQTLEAFRFAAADAEATHLLKTDDDSFIRVDKLMSALQQLPQERLFWGLVNNPGGGPFRNTNTT